MAVDKNNADNENHTEEADVEMNMFGEDPNGDGIQMEPFNHSHPKNCVNIFIYFLFLTCFFLVTRHSSPW